LLSSFLSKEIYIGKDQKMRFTKQLMLARGRYSSMMDMGGVAAAESNTKLNLGKNNRVKVVALDFELLTQSIQSSIQSHSDERNSSNTLDIRRIEKLGEVQPNISMVQNFAKMLNVTLNGEEERSGRNKKEEEKDDLSLLLGTTNRKQSNSEKENEAKSNSAVGSLPNMDIRAKYAQKLKDKIQGGLAGVDSAKFQKEEILAKGDAAGHLVARSIAASQTVATSGSKWLATTGAGTLLTFLDKRCLSIALLPPPRIVSQEEKDSTTKSMQELTRQLPYVKFDVLLPSVTGMDQQFETEQGLKQAPEILIRRLLQEHHETPSTKILVVSNQDAYLRQARDCGMLTCRIRPANAPRGNVTTSYTVERMSEVQNAVNDLIGISYNTVFSSR
jgi:hypothetical protein